MPLSSITADESVCVVLLIAEGQDASVIDHDVESISIDTSTQESEFSGEPCEIIGDNGRARATSLVMRRPV